MKPVVRIVRLKTEQQPQALKEVANLKEPFILQNLKNAIEKDFKINHSASDYASALNISPKALAKIARTHFNKTLTELIPSELLLRQSVNCTSPIKRSRKLLTN